MIFKYTTGLQINFVGLFFLSCRSGTTRLAHTLYLHIKICLSHKDQQTEQVLEFEEAKKQQNSFIIQIVN